MKTSCLRNFNVWSPKPANDLDQFPKNPASVDFPVPSSFAGGFVSVGRGHGSSRASTFWPEHGFVVGDRPGRFGAAGDSGLLLPGPPCCRTRRRRHRRATRKRRDGCSTPVQQKNAEHYQREQDRIHAEFDATTRNLSQEWKRGGDGKSSIPAASGRWRWIKKHCGPGKKTSNYLRAGFERLEHRHQEKIAGLQAEAEVQASRLADVHARKSGRSRKASIRPSGQALESEWKNKIEPLYADNPARPMPPAEQLFPGWEAPFWKKWTPPEEFKNAARFGRLEVALETFAERLPKGPAPVASRAGQLYRAAVAGLSAARLHSF